MDRICTAAKLRPSGRCGAAGRRHRDDVVVVLNAADERVVDEGEEAGLAGVEGVEVAAV